MHGGLAPAGVIDFSASINPLGPPPVALAEYHRAAETITRYPAPYPVKLAERLAEWIGVRPEQVLVGNGSTHLIYLMARHFNWQRPFVVTPTFSEIANALIAAGSAPRAIELDHSRDFRLSLDQIIAALECGADAIFIGRPNSPTGTMIDFAAVSAITRECARRGVFCIFDEAFIDFAADARSAIEQIESELLTIILRSLTKIFAIPGLRLGFVVAAPSTTAALREQIEPWAVNAIAERVALACLADRSDYLARTRDLVARERDFLATGLTANPRLQVFPSATNFLMLAVPGETKSTPGFGRFMLDRGIALRDLRALPGCGPGMYRLGVRTHEDNLRLVEAAKEYRGVNGR